MRADTSAATTSTHPGFADIPAGAAFLQSLAPRSAAARLLQGGEVRIGEEVFQLDTRKNLPAPTVV